MDTALKDPSGFSEALTILRSEDFQKKNIKRVFNAYSDNIYYLVSRLPIQAVKLLYSNG